MRVLLDYNIPVRFLDAVAGFDVTHVRQVGLAGLLDGPLLTAIEGRFDVLVTMDRNMQFQQNLSFRTFSVVVLRAKSSRLQDLKPLTPNLRMTLPTCLPGRCYEVGLTP
jgi:predicted nuclease of predicted toxin-antitoxin system